LCRRLRQRAVACAIVTLLLAGCATVPETGRTQFMMVRAAAELDMGLTAFAQIKEELTLVEEGPEYEMLQRVGHRVAAEAEPLLARRGIEDLEWEFLLADDDALNAFVLPGGKIVFYSGIMPLLEDEAGVAAVMGHEVGHLVGRHAGERISQHVLVAMSMTAAQVALARRDPQHRDQIMAALGLGALVGVMLPYSRLHESEADEIGLLLMARAGYDPREAVRVWERMAAEQETRPPEFLSTHPDPERRAAHLREIMPRALEEYRAINGEDVAAAIRH